MKLYKLTTSAGKTRPGHHNECQWGPGITHQGAGKGDLCGPGYIHAYEHPLLAVLLNPIHADYNDPLLWECDGDIAKRDHQLKVGCVSLTTVKTTPLPVITTEQRVKFGILCAIRVHDNQSFNKWAQDWLSGNDRTTHAAHAAADAAEYAAEYAAAYAAADAAADAAHAAAHAAYAAAHAAADAAAYAAADAAHAAKYSNAVSTVNLIAIAEEAMQCHA